MEPIGKQEKLICREQSLMEQVNDVAWSPNTSSVFALVADDGRVEIWDLRLTNLEPRLTFFDKITKKIRSNTSKTCVRWSRESPVIVTGNVEGVVHVYRTNGLEHVQVSHADQVARLHDSIKKDDFADDTKDNKKKEEDEDDDDDATS
jgi:WD40 repeat protein